MSKVSISGYGDSLTVNGICIGELSPDEHESIEKEKGGQINTPRLRSDQKQSSRIKMWPMLRADRTTQRDVINIPVPDESTFKTCTAI